MRFWEVLPVGNSEPVPGDGHVPGAGPSIDTTVAHSARLWNYLLGGKDNFAVDRRAAEQAIAPLPELVSSAPADRGFLGALEPGVVQADDGRVVWDNDSYRFLTGDAPDTVNPSLWRQSSLVVRQVLYEVVGGIYQVHGLDLSNITFVEGEASVIVIDPLISKETAAAVLGLYREHRGDRPVRHPGVRRHRRLAQGSVGRHGRPRPLHVPVRVPGRRQAAPPTRP